MLIAHIWQILPAKNLNSIAFLSHTYHATVIELHGFSHNIICTFLISLFSYTLRLFGCMYLHADFSLLAAFSDSFINK